MLYFTERLFLQVSLSIVQKFLILVVNYLMVPKALSLDMLNEGATKMSVSNANFFKRVQIKLIHVQDLISIRLSQVLGVFLFVLLIFDFKTSPSHVLKVTLIDKTFLT